MENKFQLFFKAGYSEKDDFETEMKGYRNDVIVQAPDGSLYEVFFYDPVRLRQDLGEGIYLSAPGLIVLNTVNRGSMESAVNDLWNRGFFKYFIPKQSLSEKHFDENI